MYFLVTQRCSDVFLSNYSEVASFERSVFKEFSLDKEEEQSVMIILFCAKLLGRAEESP